MQAPSLFSLLSTTSDAAEEINSIFLCIRALPSICTCNDYMSKGSADLNKPGGFTPVGTSGNIELCDTVTWFRFRGLPPFCQKQPSSRLGCEAMPRAFKQTKTAFYFPLQLLNEIPRSNKLPIRASSYGISLALRRQKKTAKHYFLLRWFTQLSCPRESEMSHHLSVLHQLLCGGWCLKHIIWRF